MPLSFASGMLLGLSVAAPFGPVSLLCVHRSVTKGAATGVASAFGAATAQGTFASLALNGAWLGSCLLAGWHGTLQIVSAVVLVLLGVRLLWKRVPQCVAARTAGLHSAYGSTLLLGLSNPLTIMPYLAMASVFATTSKRFQADQIAPVFGVLIGAAAWYLGLCLFATLVRRRLGDGFVRPLNRFSGCMLIGFGVLVALR